MDGNESICIGGTLICSNPAIIPTTSAALDLHVKELEDMSLIQVATMSTPDTMLSLHVAEKS